MTTEISVKNLNDAGYDMVVKVDALYGDDVVIDSKILDSGEETTEYVYSGREIHVTEVKRPPEPVRVMTGIGPDRKQGPLGWIGVDLDGTLAQYTTFEGETVIGEPIEVMVSRVKEWLRIGEKVKIFTARVADMGDGRDLTATREAIEAWTEKHIGQKLEVTNVKDWHMETLFDDRAVRVEMNTGRIL